MYILKQKKKTGVVETSDTLPKEAKHTAKDSVFTDFFRIPKYLLQLYQAIHPEDRETTAEDISNVTIKNIFLDQPYNDVGFQVGERLIILVECQSSWTKNIIVRSLMYLSQTYQEYIETTEQDVYGSKKVVLPEPELYVIFIGQRRKKPEYLCLSEEFFGGKECAVEIKVKIIYNGEKGDIINQYVRFTRIYNEQVRKFGRTRQAVLETIRICIGQDILKEYLEDRGKEVVDIKTMLFDDEYIYRTHIKSERRQAAEKAARKAEKKAQETNKRSARRLYERGTSIEEIAEILEISADQIQQWVEAVMA